MTHLLVQAVWNHYLLYFEEVHQTDLQLPALAPVAFESLQTDLNDCFQQMECYFD